jgi:IQ calmodulin-binding motif
LARAATVIQSYWRGHRARTAVASKKQKYAKKKKKTLKKENTKNQETKKKQVVERKAARLVKNRGRKK